MSSIMKRSGILVLSAALLLPSATALAAPQSLSADSSLPVSGKPLPVQAAKAKLSKEEALSIASRLVSANSPELSNSSFRSPDPWRPFPEWSFYWVKKGKAEGSVEFSYNVGVNANTGEITSYSFYQQQPNRPAYASRLSYDEARKKAEQFLAQYVPSKAAETRLSEREVPVQKTPLGTEVHYNFRFVRTVNGILVPDNSADIVVNAAGQIVNYSLNWNDQIQFETPKHVISQEAAEKLFQTKMNANLSYFLPWERQGENAPKPFLAYRNPFDTFVDAGTGELLTLALQPKNKAGEPIRVSDKKLPPHHSGGVLSQDDAVKLAQKLFDLSQYRLRGANFNEKDFRGGRSIWNLEFESKDEKQRPGFLYVSLDASTGDVYMFNKEKGFPGVKEGGSKPASSEQLKAKALDLVRSWIPGWANQLYLMNNQANEPVDPYYPRYTFQFQRMINGITTATGTAQMAFDAETGELMHYNFDFGKETYPAQPPKHISQSEAMQAWLKEAAVEKVYALLPMSPEAAAKAKQGEGAVLERKAKLVYRATVTPNEQPYVLDAANGEWKSEMTGKPVILHRTTPADIAGHPAEKALMLMYEYDAISTVDGKLMPDKKITRGEMIEMLMIALNNGRYFPEWNGRKASFHDVSTNSRYFAAVEAAVDRGILDVSSPVLNPDQPITREELADMLVRGLGYRKLAQHADMFANKLTDIGSSQARGSIIIVTSLGIMSAANDRFQPQANVSRAEAAVAFARFLEKRSDLEERRTY